MGKILKNKILIIFILVFVLLVIGIEVGMITNPTLKYSVGMGLIGGGSVLLIVVPIFIIQKLWVWIKSKL